MSQPVPRATAPAPVEVAPEPIDERLQARIALSQRSAQARPVQPPRFLVRGAPDIAGFSRPLTGWPSFGLEPAPAHGEREVGTGEAFREAYLSARGQLAARRVRRRLAQAEPDASAPIASPEQVQAALRAMQAAPMTLVQSGGGPVLPRLAHVKQDLLLELRRQARGGAALRLSDGDEDTLELVGTLFEALTRDHAEFARLPSLLARLQITILRVALSGPQFLLDHRHPARRFLGTAIEYLDGWLDEGAADQPTVAELARLVERAVTGFSGDAALFDDLSRELAAAHAVAMRKAQLSERRHVEAAAGRDRLEDARAKARAAIALRLARGAASPLVRALLEQEWTRVLALALAREAPGGPMAASCLAAADRLIDAFATVDRAKGGRIELTEEQFLRQTLSIGLTKVGYHGGDLQLILERLFSEDPRAHHDDSLPARARAAASSEPNEAGDERRPREPASPREQALSTSLRALPPGSWLELAPEDGTATVRRKLAWVSASGAPCPLLNWRGAKAGELATEDLARAIAAGRARVMAREDESVLDRTIRRLPVLLRERLKAAE